MPDCPRCGVAYLDGESHSCAEKDRSWLMVAVVGTVLLWIALSVAGAPVVTMTNYMFIVIIGLGKMILGGLLARLLRVVGYFLGDLGVRWVRDFL
jgi:hypothetical protein